MQNSRPYRFWTGIVPWLLLAVAALLGIWWAWLRHAAFRTNIYDLGYYTQTLWNTAHGRFFATSLKPGIYLADHFSPVMLLFVPFFRWLPQPRILLAVQVIAVGTAVIPAYLLLRRRDPVWAPLLVVAFLFNPLLHQVLYQEFHEIMLAAPTLALALYGLQARRRRWLLLGALLTLLVREDMPVYVALLAVYLILFQAEWRREGVFLLGLSTVWLLLVTRWIMPLLGSDYTHGRRLAESLGGVDVLARLRQPARAQAVVRLLAPLAGLPLLGRGTQILWLPAVVLMLLFAESGVGTLSSWHVAPLLPLLWFGAADALTGWPRRAARAGLIVLLAASVLGFYWWSYAPGGRYFDGSPLRLTLHDRIGREIVTAVPPDASVMAQSGLGAHLAARRSLWLFPWTEETTQPEWVVLDVKAANTYPLPPSELAHQVTQWQIRPDYRTFWEQDGYFVFVYEPGVLPAAGRWEWDQGITLRGYEWAQADEYGRFRPVDKLRGGATTRIDLYWQTDQPLPVNYSVSVRLLAPDGWVTAQHDGWPGQGTLGTAVWQPGQLYRDTHYLELPPDLPSDLRLVVLLYEPIENTPLPPAEGYELTVIPVRRNE